MSEPEGTDERMLKKLPVEEWIEKVRADKVRVRKEGSKNRVTTESILRARDRRPEVKVVVDTSALAAGVADLGRDGAWSEAAMAEATREGRALAVPQIALAEASNVLRRLELAERLETSEANLARRDLLALHIEPFPFEPLALADRVWELRHRPIANS